MVWYVTQESGQGKVEKQQTSFLSRKVKSSEYLMDSLPVLTLKITDLITWLIRGGSIKSCRFSSPCSVIVTWWIFWFQRTPSSFACGKQICVDLWPSCLFVSASNAVSVTLSLIHTTSGCPFCRTLQLAFEHIFHTWYERIIECALFLGNVCLREVDSLFWTLHKHVFKK